MFTRPAALALLAGSLLSSTAFAQDKPAAQPPPAAPAADAPRVVQPEAKQKVDAMVQAFKAAQSLSFSSSLTGTGMMAILPEMRGDVTMARNGTGTGASAWKTRVEGSRAAAGSLDKSSTEMTYILGSDGVKTTWIDHPSKTVFQRSSASAQGEPINVTNLIIPRDFVAAEPFADIVSAPSLTLEEPPATADGVKCDIIAVETAGKEKLKIAIAQTDHLPRRIVKYLAGGGDAAQIWNIKSVATGIVTTPDTWAVKTPEGYTFSPEAVPAAPTAPATPAPSRSASGTPISGAPSAAAPGPRVRSIGVNADDLAPDFELKNQQGETVRLSGLKGTVVVLDFWGTWCPPCKVSSPEIQKLADKYKTGVKFLGLAVREQSDAAPTAYWEAQKHTYPLLLKADEVAKTYRVKNFPAFFVIGKEGEIVWTANGWGEPTPGKLTEAIDAALAGRTLAAPPAPPATKAPEQPGSLAPTKSLDGAPGKSLKRSSQDDTGKR